MASNIRPMPKTPFQLALLNLPHRRAQRRWAITIAATVIAWTLAALWHWFFYARPEPSLGVILASLSGFPVLIISSRVSTRLLHAERAARSCCPACGYDLRATPVRCPECGTSAADANQLTLAAMPRRTNQLRFRRAYVVGLALSVPLSFISQFARQSFGWGTWFALWTGVSLVIAAIALVNLLTVYRRQ